MQKSVKIPVTVKCRLGVDDLDKYENVHNFITIVSTIGGIKKFIIHARKCLLNGLSPKENRTIPPLKYDWVLRLKKDFPHLDFVINGGFTTMEMVIYILFHIYFRLKTFWYLKINWKAVWWDAWPITRPGIWSELTGNCTVTPKTPKIENSYSLYLSISIYSVYRNMLNTVSRSKMSGWPRANTYRTVYL